MKIAILGGDGFCGWPAALHLSERGHDVITVDNMSRRRIDEEPIGTGRTVELDYLVVVEPETLSEIPPRPGALALVAARVGTTRLIDNREIEAAPRP